MPHNIVVNTKYKLIWYRNEKKVLDSQERDQLMGPIVPSRVESQAEDFPDYAQF